MTLIPLAELPPAELLLERLDLRDALRLIVASVADGERDSSLDVAEMMEGASDMGV